MYLHQMSIHKSYILYKNHTSDSKIMDLLDFHEMIYSSLMNFNPDEWQPSGYFVETASNNDLVEEQSSRIDETLPPKNKRTRYEEPLNRLNRQLNHYPKSMAEKKN